MAKKTDSERWRVPELAELRRQVEELALRMVVADPAAAEYAAAMQDWIAPLERIREDAAKSQAPQVAAAAAATIESVRQAASANPEGADGLQEGMARLQQALEVEMQQTESRDTSLAQDPELLSDFVLESREHLAAVEAQVLTLEREPRDTEALNAIFRGFHTVKGLAGFLELWDVQKLAHEVETVLDRARNFQLSITPVAIDVILESADQLRRWLAHVEALLQNRPTEAPPENVLLLRRIRGLSESTAETPPAAGEQTTVELITMAQAVSAGVIEEKAVAPATALGTPRNETMAVKVNTAKLDYLVDMAGEMVIAESLVRHDPDLATIKNPRLHRNLAQLTRITAELQKTSMSMRLVPIGPLFGRMARLVRDLSRQFGKQVQMETQGDDIELDRNIVEELADPLMHMVRNALDHGVETPAERTAQGKNPQAHVQLRAHHQAGQVVIEIADDGRGLDRARIVGKAVERGLIATGDGMTDSEIYNLIFEPGFSTAAQVTNVSGRGVGMDVVRRHIGKLRGRIEIRSALGGGSTFVLKLPLTLAIIDALVVGVGQERYIVPLFAVREMFRPVADTIWTVQQKAEMALVRDTLLPVLRLYRKFGVTPRSEDPQASVLVVAETEGQRFCLLVDDLIGKQEVVIKSLGETFKSVTGIAGGAILGDGRVGLILDLDRLFQERNADATH
jgi:two-component system chemotaxis sensor kinase CheA